MRVTIFTNNAELDPQAVDVRLNGKTIDIQVSSGQIQFQYPIQGAARLDLRSSSPLVVEDVQIDDNSIRELLYLSFLTENGQHSQPRTDIQNGNVVWTLPIIYPLSQMFSYVQNTLRAGTLGQDILKDWHLFVPESVEIRKSNPRILQDFFAMDAQFTLVTKNQPPWGSDNRLPFEKASVPGNIQLVNDEFEKQSSTLNLSPGYATQNEKNIKEFGLEDTWKYLYVIEQDNNKEMSDWRERFSLDKAVFPQLYNFIDQIPKINIHQGYIAELPSGSFIFPHCDCKPSRWGEIEGCAVLYTPMKQTSDVYFKFANFGLVDLSGPSYINNRRYCHAVVNDSPHPRYILSLTLKLQ